MSKFLSVFLALAIATAGLEPIAARGDQSLASTYAVVKQSLALIAYRKGKFLFTGSAFCVGNVTHKDGTATSFLLTNAHVVGGSHTVGVSLASDQKRWQTGTVVRTNADLDLALVAIAGVVPPLRIVRNRLPEGSAIAIAGYPGSNVEFALAGLGLSPAVHQGIVNSYEAGGRFMIFDAQVERGNSGGPVFDPSTGNVYAIVDAKVGSDETNIGIGINSAMPFLQNSGVALGATRGVEVAQVTPTTATTPQPETPMAPATIDAELSGDVAEILANTSDFGSQDFGVVVPLIVRDQHYRCSSGTTMIMRIRQASAGDSLVVQLPYGTLYRYTSVIERHDSKGNMLFVGNVARNGLVTGPRDPALILPVHHPAAGEAIAIQASDGASGVRTWLGSAMIRMDEHHYSVQVYQDTFKQGITRAAYADRVGLVGVLYENTLSQVVRACELESITAAHR